MRKPNQRGIVMIELLVVIALLGSAAAIVILLPHSFAPCRSPGRRSVCSSNLKEIHYAITMYEQEYGCFPTRARVGHNPYTDGDAQEAMNLLYRQYTDDVRIFSCPSKPLNPVMLNNILPTSPVPWPGPPGTTFKESPPGVAGTSTSYGYSPGHNSANSRVVIAADRKGIGPKGNSDNHGAGAGQNVLTAGGSVSFITTPFNALGKDDDERHVIDSDIFSWSNITPWEYYDWDSACR